MLDNLNESQLGMLITQTRKSINNLTVIMKSYQNELNRRKSSKYTEAFLGKCFKVKKGQEEFIKITDIDEFGRYSGYYVIGSDPNFRDVFIVDGLDFDNDPIDKDSEIPVEEFNNIVNKAFQAVLDGTPIPQEEW